MVLKLVLDPGDRDGPPPPRCCCSFRPQTRILLLFMGSFEDAALTFSSNLGPAEDFGGGRRAGRPPLRCKDHQAAPRIVGKPQRPPAGCYKAALPD